MSNCCVERDVILDSLFDDSGMFSNDERTHGSGQTTETLVGRRGSSDAVVVGQSEVTEAIVGNAVVVPCIDGGNAVNSCEDDESWIPMSGMLVQHVIEGFVKYSNYARKVGFQIRFRSSEKKGKSNGAEIECRRKRMIRGLGRSWFYSDYESCSRVRLQCVKGEAPRVNRRDPNRPARSQASKCPAGVSLLNNGDGSWVFGTVKLEHNHICDPEMTRFMKNYRIVSGNDELQIVVSDMAGVIPSRIYTSVAVGYGGVENVPFSMDDCRSIVRKARSNGLEDGDFNSMQKLFNKMIAASDDFFYLYDTDDDGRVKNVFWADGRSRGAYKDFGDVVCFDTTHLKNRYKMPLAPFIGVNHHGQSILLGLALISSEDTDSFIWVFQAWMKCMKNKHPKCIMTDQCQAIGKGIAAVFPNSRHRWCLWHVMRNGEIHLKKNPEWVGIRKALKEAVHDAVNVVAFEGMWNEMLSKYDLQGNDWIRRMFDARERWVPVYFKDEFWAGLHSTQRSEGMNNFFRSYVNLNTSLRQFAEQYCFFVGKRVDDEERESWRSINKPVLCATRFPCERVLQKIYTCNKFLEIQNEAKGVAYTNIELVTTVDGIRTYMVTDMGVEKVYGDVVRQMYFVEYNATTHITKCECCLFTFRGIICRHMIAVWGGEDLRFVPHIYILDRWRKDKFREYSLIKPPNYSLAFNKSGEYRKVDDLNNIMREIASLALGCDDLYTALMPGLEILRKKCGEFIATDEDIRVDSVGRFYKPNVDGGDETGVPDLRVEFVLDPPDKRGRGRVPNRRKGYRKDKRKRTDEGTAQASTQQLFA